MAKIFYGVQGSGHGHAVRALTVARQFPEHEFLFLSFGAGAEILRREYPVEELPGPDTVYHDHRLAVFPTLLTNLCFWMRLRATQRRVLELMDRFQPDAALSDYEFLVPRAARRIGLPCLSLDHQHIITCCRHRVPRRRLPEYWTTAAVIRLLYHRASEFMVTSFFQPPVRSRGRVKLVPPLLRESVLQRPPQPGEHVLAYQGHPTFRGFLDFLRQIPHPVKAYGFDRHDQDGNLRFRKNSEEGFLEDLASCRYVVCGAGHTMISEALYYGKPVLSFPIKNAFEQFLNAFYLERLGYGRYHIGMQPGPGLIPSFEARLDDFTAAIRLADFCGNQEIFSLLDRFIRQKSMSPGSTGNGSAI